MATEFEKLIADVTTLKKRVADLEKPSGKVRFPDGLDCALITYTSSPTANTEDGVDHPLKREPAYFMVVDKTSAVELYRGTTPWTSSKIFIRAATGGTKFTLVVF